MPNSTSATAQSQVGATRGTEVARRPTDDEILGLTTSQGFEIPSSHGGSDGDVPGFDEATEEQAAGEQAEQQPTEPGQYSAIFESNPELAEAWRDARGFREIFPTVETARAAGAQVAELARLDTLFFSNRPESHAELAAAIFRLNPTAFRSLSQMMHAISKNNGESSLLGSGTHNVSTADHGFAAAVRSREARASEGAENVDLQSRLAPDPPISAAHEHAFFHETNAAAVEGVLSSIQTQLDRILPENTPKNARQRLTGEIYRELDSALQANRAFGQQLRQAFRSGPLSAENQRAIVGIVVGRARQALPGIAKRVLGEWTNGVVAHATTRHERQRSAARRIDIGGGAPGGDGPRSLMPKDIDYRRMSDNDILNM